MSTLGTTIDADRTLTVPAGFLVRLVAWLIDACAIGTLVTLLTLGHPLPLAEQGPAELAHPTHLLDTFVSFAYFTLLWSGIGGGATLGMRVLGLRVVGDGGEPIEYGTAVMRFVGLVLSIVPLFAGVLWVALDPQRQGWHDKLARTWVIREGAAEPEVGPSPSEAPGDVSGITTSEAGPAETPAPARDALLDRAPQSATTLLRIVVGVVAALALVLVALVGGLVAIVGQPHWPLLFGLGIVVLAMIGALRLFRPFGIGLSGVAALTAVVVFASQLTASLHRSWTPLARRSRGASPRCGRWASVATTSGSSCGAARRPTRSCSS